MADFTALKTAIQNAIKQNGNEEITGNLLQEVLLAIVTTLGDGSINDLINALGTEATTRSQADGTLQQNINAEAQARGNADTALGGRIDGVIESINAINAAIGNGYVYAGIATPSSTPITGKVFYLALTSGTYTNFGNIAVTQGVNILKYNGSAWSLDTFVGIDDTPTPNSPNLVKSGGAFDSVMTNGSAFDISAHFASGGTLATYANLSAALTALNTLSAAYKKGGMSIKFVQSSDNKYVQYRCKSQNFSINSDDWINVEEEVSQLGQQLSKDGTLRAYISGGYNPTFVVNSDKTIQITLPNSDIQIYNQNGNLIYTVTSGMNQTYTLSLTQVLVFDLDANPRTIAVKAANASGNHIILFSNNHGSLSGLLSYYYFNREIKDYEDTCDAYISWRSGLSPTFSYNSNNGTVTIAFPNTEFNIFRRNGGRVVDTSTSGKNTTFTVQSNQLLIYDKTDNTVKVVGNGDARNNCYILFGNVFGNAFSGLMVSYFIKQLFDKSEENSAFIESVNAKTTQSIYFTGFGKAEYYKDGNSIIVTLPSSGYVIYGATGKKLQETSAGAGMTFTIPNNSMLVYDRDIPLADGPVKVVSNTTDGNYWVLLVNCGGITFGPIANHLMQYGNSIGKLYGTELEKIIFQNLKKTNATNYESAGYTPLSLLHFSDIHGQEIALNRIMQYRKMFTDKIDDVLNTGDTVSDTLANGMTFFNNISGSEYILNVIGNHDRMRNPSENATQAEAYAAEIAPYISNWGVVQPQGGAADSLCYYYKDYSSAGVRLIVLDNFATDMPAQVAWLGNVLDDAITHNLTVVCAIHFPPTTTFMKNITFCSIDAHIADTTQEVLLSAVDTFINDGGKFACWLSGHTHQDFFGTVSEHPNQVTITIGNALSNQESGSVARLLGTKSQDLFNIFSVDCNTKCIKLHRVGADRDRYMRHIGELCYNYDTKQIVYND